MILKSLRWSKIKTALAVVGLAFVAYGFAINMVFPLDRGYVHEFPPAVRDAGEPFAAIAGEYDQGDGLGTRWSLILLPDGRYSFLWSGCLGRYHHESGSSRWTDGLVLLSPIEPIEPKMARVFAPVRWGRRSYLIPPEKLKRFCEDIVQGEEPRTGRFVHYYTKGMEFPVDGSPELPEPWATDLSDHLVIGTIVALTEKGQARANIGSSQGVQVGAVLVIQGTGRSPRRLRALSVEEDSCELGTESPGSDEEPIGVGMKVVTERARPSR